MSAAAGAPPRPADGAHAVQRLRRIGLVTQELDALAGFYERAFGFEPLERRRRQGAQFEQLMQVSGAASSLVLELGRQSIELLQFDRPGSAYPGSLGAADPRFQHFAIVVAAMQPAFARLEQVPGWTPISSGGPQRLPRSSGGVTAFKFRDPDGHPLELLYLPQPPRPWQAPGGRLCLGIDHSAICVADTARSVAFYAGLGLTAAGGSLNVGEEQARLDALLSPQVQVTAMVPPEAPAHVELLCYRTAAGGLTAQGVTAQSVAANDVAATRLMFETRSSTAAPRALTDPDGHRVLLL